MTLRIRGIPLVLFFCLLWPILSEGLLHAMPRVQRIVLSNGLTVLVSEEHSLPIITVHLLIDAGSRRDPPGEEGLARLTARGLLLGTSSRTVSVFHEELDFVGASLDASVGRDYATLSLRMLKKDMEKGFDLMMDALRQPLFSEEQIKREVEKTLGAIRSAENAPGEVAEKAFRKTLFRSSPYGHPAEGTKESLPRLTRETTTRFYRSHYHPTKSILTVVGDISMDEVRRELLPLLAKWPKGEAPPEVFKSSFERDHRAVKIDRPISQANIILGHRGVSRNNPDYYALTVMNYILGGGGFASRLVEEIRIKRGLAYAVYSFFDPGKYPGSFQIVLQTKNASARETVSLSLGEMERIRKEPVSEKELDGAKRYLIGSFPMRLDTQAKLANFLSQVEYYALGRDYAEKYPSLINAVSREEVLRVAKTYLHPKNTILVVVANLKEAGFE